MTNEEKDLRDKINALKIMQNLFTVGNHQEITADYGEDVTAEVWAIFGRLSKQLSTQKEILESSKIWVVVVSSETAKTVMYVDEHGKKTDRMPKAQGFGDINLATEEAEKYRFGRLKELK